jgi:hypothetical protein
MHRAPLRPRRGTSSESDVKSLTLLSSFSRPSPGGNDVQDADGYTSMNTPIAML